MEFTTQHGTTGDVDLKVSNEFDATELAAAMRVKELETVSGIVDLTHQVVTQIVAGRRLSVLDCIELWRSHTASSRILSPVTVHVSHKILMHWVRSTGAGLLPVTSITPALVSDYVNGGNERRSTALRKLTAIRQLFSFCLENGYCFRNPAGPALVRVNFDTFTHGEKEKVEKQPFSDVEVSRLLTMTCVDESPFWYLACKISLNTGLRLGDIAKLERDSVGIGTISVWTEKTDKRVEVATPLELNRMVLSTPGQGKYIFPEQAAMFDDPVKRPQLSMQFYRLCRKAGITGKSFHCLRHTYATRQIEAGKSTVDVAKDLGHSNTETTEGYIHTPNERTRATDPQGG